MRHPRVELPRLHERPSAHAARPHARLKSSCDVALGIAGDWLAGARVASPPERVLSYECAFEPHSFDQVLVQCDHRGAKKAIAFVYREPPAAPALDGAAG